ncbi:MAG: transcription-repair coupling factor [Eubacteriales bacterium]|nr:transcription-repair coupling factor [Eubacteriales bacterium]
MIEYELKQLLNHVRLDPAYTRLAGLFSRNQRQPVNVFGLQDTQKTVLALALATELGNKPCILVPDELRARAVAADLRALLDQPVLVFRPRELNLTDADATSHEEEHARQAILGQLQSGDFAALVIPAAALLQRLIAPKIYRAATIQLTIGQQIAPKVLAEALLAAGFERMRLIEGPGQFAMRGDILDIGLARTDDSDEANGIRLSFFDDEIDAIKTFDVESQRSQTMLQAVTITPVREILPTPDQQALIAEQMADIAKCIFKERIAAGAFRDEAEAFRQLAHRDVERFQQHLSFAGLDRWLALFTPEKSTILDHAQAAGCLFFLDEPLRWRNRLDASQAEFDERIRAMLSKTQVLPLTAESQLRGVDIARWIDQHGRIVALANIAASGNGLPGGNSIDINGRPADGFRGREEKLASECADWLRQGTQPFLFTGSESRRQRLYEFFREHDLALTISDSPLKAGFVWPAAQLAIVGTQDIFGSERQSRRRHSNGIKIDLFSDLVPGEMVVHEAHGIGRYDGLVQVENSGVRRDYLHVTYANSDSLYIPMESLDQLQKFVGAEGKEPKLSKLGGQEWARQKEKARDSIRKLATDLIKLYAERAARKGNDFGEDTVWQREFEEDFPYEETADQLTSIAEIKQDMASEKVMDRLLCGDVGFGKTEVAFRAVFKAVMGNKQAAFLAPTTVLAQQHFENLKKRMAGFPVTIGLLSRFANDAMQKQTVSGAITGKVDIVVGTHRLLSKDVVFKNLGLLVVDEEQRFGVDHKEKIKATYPMVDVLTLSATPIPRTLHMAMSGIRDISVLEEPPHDRRPVQTYVMEYDEEIMTEAILRELSRQGQVFYLFNDTHRIVEKAAHLEKLLPGARITVAHGKMSEKRLEEVIEDFIEGQADVLVCTTIIESGIDMPHVNTIIIEDADRLGLAQLYQLRGRVGRSDRQAFAYVTYRRDKILTEVAEKRLAAIRDFTELGAGFKIALRDLEVRGAGNLLGGEQHGHLDAIGYDLYCKMLEEAILEQKGESVEKAVAATIDLSLDAFIPKVYIPDEGQRMDMYRRIGGIRTLSDYTDVHDELIDRYGDIPDPVIWLTDIALIRAAAGRCGFIKIETAQDNFVLTYAENKKPDMAGLSGLLGAPQFKGRILFNAGTKPYLVFRAAAKSRPDWTKNLRELFTLLDRS